MVKPWIPLLCLLLAASANVQIAQADVPTVLSVAKRSEGGNILLDVKITHGSPTPSHYVDRIDVELDGVVKQFAGLSPQAAVEAAVTVNLGAVSPQGIRIRAICNVHGPSQWFVAQAPPPASGGTPPTQYGGGIPGYPMEAIAIALVAVAFTLLRRR